MRGLPQALPMVRPAVVPAGEDEGGSGHG
jgi:hypothetical protein